MDIFFCALRHNLHLDWFKFQLVFVSGIVERTVIKFLNETIINVYEASFGSYFFTIRSLFISGDAYALYSVATLRT